MEHVGSIELGQKFALDSMKMLKPGGLAVHTTEFTLSSSDATLESGDTVFWRKKDLIQLLSSLQSAGYDIVDQPNELCLKVGTEPMDLYVDPPPFNSFNHMRLAVGGHTITSVLWTSQVPDSGV